MLLTCSQVAFSFVFFEGSLHNGIKIPAFCADAGKRGYRWAWRVASTKRADLCLGGTGVGYVTARGSNGAGSCWRNVLRTGLVGLWGLRHCTCRTGKVDKILHIEFWTVRQSAVNDTVWLQSTKGAIKVGASV